mgnify:CR=1 FL=1
MKRSHKHWWELVFKYTGKKICISFQLGACSNNFNKVLRVIINHIPKCVNGMWKWTTKINVPRFDNFHLFHSLTYIVVSLTYVSVKQPYSEKGTHEILKKQTRFVELTRSWIFGGSSRLMRRLWLNRVKTNDMYTIRLQVKEVDTYTNIIKRSRWMNIDDTYKTHRMVVQVNRQHYMLCGETSGA